MRFLYAAVALFSSLVLAQTQENAINIPEGQSTLDVSAGESTTITWSNPSSGTVTIKLQQSNGQITPDSGITLASSIPASDGTATFTVDPAAVNSFQYTIEIIDDSDSSNMNFSPNFGITGAEGTTTATASTASITDSSSTATDSTATDSTMTSSASDSSSAAASTSDSSSTESSETTSSAAASQTTTAPSSDDNGAAGLRVQGGLVAAIAVAVAVL